MKRLGEVFRGPNQEQTYIYEVGESELDKLSAVADVPLKIIRMIVNLHRTAKELNEWLERGPAI